MAHGGDDTYSPTVTMCIQRTLRQPMRHWMHNIDTLAVRPGQLDPSPARSVAVERA